MNSENNSKNWWEVKSTPQNLDIPNINKNQTLEQQKELNNFNSNNANSPIINSQNYTEISEDELMRSFIGKNLEKFTNPFNFAAFFFGSTYYYFRKMILYGIIITIIETIITTIFGFYILTTKDIYSILILPGIALLFRLFLGAITNRVYYHFVKTKIKDIQEKDFKYNIGNVKESCIKKGGRSFVYAIVLGMVLNYALTIPFNSINNIVTKITEISTNYVENNNNNK